MDAAGPLTPDEIAARLAPWLGAGAPGGAVLAVSGGPDSTALMGCAALLPPLVPVVVATVDHRLREGSAAEAEAVAAAAAALGLRHRLLVWDGAKPASGIQDAARAARYALLAALAAEVGAASVLTAHTLDDQAETVLLRLCRGSGPAGLAGMAPARPLGAATLARPFLDLAKARLVATCAAHGWTFAADPSNRDPRFARARLRGLMPALAAEGLTAPRLARLAGRLRRDEAALDAAAAEAWDRLRRESPGAGRVVLDGAGFLALPEAVALRLLARVVAHAGDAGRPRLERLEALLAAVRPALAGGGASRRTLGGALVTAASGHLTVTRAPPRRGRGSGSVDAAG
ncbi:tRNA lysidine(34) synthetase TilS [uncultured Methylobacterium sp.]|uniref:tRNA lysidine(34) synthetase TilS n=1 Tax=uncultured Methylobacterium sp. TaxID=157278 RepID=UPI0026073930|nr:tRNA lysidine(34) synthetase TilS [uncultured Methylobacterium sp.]